MAKGKKGLFGLIALGVLGVSGWLGYKAYQVKNAVANFSVSISALNNFKFDITTLSFMVDATIKITNPSNIAISVEKIFGSLTYNSTKLGNYATSQNVTIKPNTASEVVVEIKLPLVSTLQTLGYSVTTILGKTKLSRSITIDSTVRAGGIEVSNSNTFTI